MKATKDPYVKTELHFWRETCAIFLLVRAVIAANTNLSPSGLATVTRLISNETTAFYPDAGCYSADTIGVRAVSGSRN